MTLIFKKLKVSQIRWTYIVTTLLIFFYPFGLFLVDELINPPPPGPRCGIPVMGFFIGSIIVLLPISLILQFVFNKIFFARNYKSTVIASRDIELNSLIDNIKTARQDIWEYKKWFARPALVEKKGAGSQLYTGQTFDKKYIELKEDGWTHDHCDFCRKKLADYEETENYGYYNGYSWICKLCYNSYIKPTDIEKIIEQLKTEKNRNSKD